VHHIMTHWIIEREGGVGTHPQPQMAPRWLKLGGRPGENAYYERAPKLSFGGAKRVSPLHIYIYYPPPRKQLSLEKETPDEKV
jgi:hypothetical protein